MATVYGRTLLLFVFTPPIEHCNFVSWSLTTNCNWDVVSRTTQYNNMWMYVLCAVFVVAKIEVNCLLSKSGKSSKLSTESLTPRVWLNRIANLSILLCGVWLVVHVCLLILLISPRERVSNYVFRSLLLLIENKLNVSIFNQLVWYGMAVFTLFIRFQTVRIQIFLGFN